MPVFYWYDKKCKNVWKISILKIWLYYIIFKCTFTYFWCWSESYPYSIKTKGRNGSSQTIYIYVHRSTGK